MESFLKVHLHLDACSIPFRTTFHDKMSSISMNPQNYFRNNNNTSTPNRPMLCGRCRGRSTARRAAAPSRSTRGRSAWATSATTMKRWPRSGWRRTYGTRPNGSSRSRKVQLRHAEVCFLQTPIFAQIRPQLQPPNPNLDRFEIGSHLGDRREIEFAREEIIFSK